MRHGNQGNTRGERNKGHGKQQGAWSHTQQPVVKKDSLYEARQPGRLQGENATRGIESNKGHGHTHNNQLKSGDNQRKIKIARG